MDVSQCGVDECCDCRNELNLCKLCVKKEKVKCLIGKTIIAEELCATDLNAVNFQVQNQVVNNLCVPYKIQATQAEVTNLVSTAFCSQQGTISNLCVNELTVGNINHCQKWRAAVTLSVNTAYTLGAPVNWDTIIDDPNGNVSVGPFSYTVPVSGYYNLNFHLDVIGLTGAVIISGIPVGRLQVKSNGIELVDNLAVYLSFSNEQSGNMGALVLLNAGDIITMQYDLLVIDPTSGLTPYVGTCTLPGNGMLLGKGFFTIHYLSSLNCTPGQTCQPCPPVQVPCVPVTVSCGDCEHPCPPHPWPPKADELLKNCEPCQKPLASVQPVSSPASGSPDKKSTGYHFGKK